MRRKLPDAVVVVTGASSGIGRAAALSFAEEGATVVLAARRGEALEEVARECEEKGGRALAVTTDVTRQEQVEHLAREAIENFGRIDVWVNNAAVTLFGRFEEIPIEPFRQVIETNLFGYIYGAREAIRYFREQGNGVLINVSSVVGRVPQPYTAPYGISKYGIVGLSECLRMELDLDDADIHVCTVLPASIDTPLFQQGANYTGRAARPLEPIHPPEKVAEAIVELARNPQPEVNVGRPGRMITVQHRLTPRLYEKLGARKIAQDHFQDRPEPQNDGNLYRPMPEYAQVSGGWREEQGSSAGKLALAGLAVAVPLLLWAVRTERVPQPWQ